MKKSYLYILSVLFGFLQSCTTEEKQILPPYEDRVSEAASELMGELIVPENGWKVNYKPNPISGTYFVLLDFNEDGNVRIQSDLSADNGEYYDQTMPYRVDVALNTELILETYGFFHYLFEANQSTFGGEFEFIYKGKDGSNLLFESKSDQGVKTQLVFEPAGPNEDQLFSRELSENLEQFEGYNPYILGTLPALQHVILENQDISIYWELDPRQRMIGIGLAGEGNDIDEVFALDNFIEVFHISGYSLSGNKLILNVPFSFNLTGTNITIAELTLNQFTMDGPPICPSGSEGTPRYTGQINGVGPMTMETSLVSTGGFGFREDNVYTVNSFFVFDSLANSLVETGSIADYYPNAGAFAFLYGAPLINDSIPKYSTGIIDEIGDLHVRSFDSTITVGNRVNVALSNGYYFSSGITPEKILNINAVTDEIFEGGVIYAYEFPISGLVVFWLYNPCNRYEFALVQ